MTQEDIRQFQMAKAAIAVGQKTLLKAAGMEAWQVKRYIWQAAWVPFLNVRAAVETGLVEKFFAGGKSRREYFLYRGQFLSEKDRTGADFRKG